VSVLLFAFNSQGKIETSMATAGKENNLTMIADF